MSSSAPLSGSEISFDRAEFSAGASVIFQLAELSTDASISFNDAQFSGGDVFFRNQFSSGQFSSGRITFGNANLLGRKRLFYRQVLWGRVQL